MATRQSDAELAREVRRAARAGEQADLVEPRATHARYNRTTDMVELTLADGCLFAFPSSLAQGLRGAPPDLLERVEVLGDGYALRWEELDADLTVPGLLAGRLGSRAWMAQALGRAGGRVKSAAKAKAARENGRKGGRPRKHEGKDEAR